MSDNSEIVSRDEARLSRINSYPFEFDPHKTDYAPRNALACALASSLSYLSDKALVNQVANRWGCNTEFLENGNPDWGLSLIGKDFVLIAFRGTDDWSDWWTSNLRVFPARTPWGWVHKGFMGARERLWPDVHRILARLSRETSIWLTGHSLGGAIAQLTVKRVFDESANWPNAVYTFSQPRAAGPTFARRVREHITSYYRFVNSIDSTPNTPFNPWSAVGSEYYVNASGKIYADGSARFWDKGKDQITVDGSWGESRKRPSEGLSKTLGIDAHSIERYFEPLYNEIRNLD